MLIKKVGCSSPLTPVRKYKTPIGHRHSLPVPIEWSNTSKDKSQTGIVCLAIFGGLCAVILTEGGWAELLNLYYNGNYVAVRYIYFVFSSFNRKFLIIMEKVFALLIVMK